MVQLCTDSRNQCALLFVFKGMFLFLLALLSSCRTTKSGSDTATIINDSIKNVYAPDKRVALYQVSINPKNKELLLTGETNLPEALGQLKQELSSKNFAFTDSVLLLPDGALKELRYAIVNNSVANLRSEGKHSAELATQALLGTPLKVLKTNGDFYLVQTPDGYISWVPWRNKINNP